MSTSTTFNLNDTVFIQKIGYGTLVDCGKLKSIPTKEVPINTSRRQSIYFDPDLFNSQSQALSRQISQATILVPHPKTQAKNTNQQKKQQVLPIEQPLKTQPPLQNGQSQSKVQQQQPAINIVKVKLDGTIAFIYTLVQNIRKYVIIPVRPLFAPALGTINIRIEINKTIQSFKRQIFQLLGLVHSHYYNVKIFSTSPILSELNCQSKTIHQYGLRETSTLTMTAQHGFCFEPIPTHFIEYFNLLNNNLTLVSLPKKPKVVTNTVIVPPALPAQQSQNSVSTQSIENSTQTSTKKIQNTETQANQTSGQQQKKVQQPITDNSTKKENSQTQTEVKTQAKIEKIIKQIQPPQTLCLAGNWLVYLGDKIMSSGNKYFEVRLDKLPQNNSHLKIGISSLNNQQTWNFSPLISKKTYQQNNQVKTSQLYGMTFKQNDIIGVFARIDKNKILKINFFKNNVNLGLCIETKIKQIKFVFTIGSQGQISLDTRAQLPIDAYRFK